MRGRPVGTILRERIAAILSQLGTSYAYELYKIYKVLFGAVKLRNFYYNLKKGVERGEVVVVDTRQESGSFTWGDETKRVYYANGPFAKPISPMPTALLNYPKREFSVDWPRRMKEIAINFNHEMDLLEVRRAKIRPEVWQFEKQNLRRRMEGLIISAKDKGGPELAKEIKDTLKY